MKETLLGFVLMAVIIGAVVFIGIKRNNVKEVSECHHWQEEAAQFDTFYLVKWQADQCASHNITINALVK